LDWSCSLSSRRRAHYDICTCLIQLNSEWVSRGISRRYDYFAPDGGAEYCDERVSVCLSVCVCVCVCLSAIISSELHIRSSPNFLRTNFLHTLPMAVARSFSGGVAIRYVLPVLLITSSSLTSQGWSRRRRPAEAQRTRSLGLGYKLCALMPAAGHRTHGTTFRVLKGTSQVAATGAESAVCDGLLMYAVHVQVA